MLVLKGSLCLFRLCCCCLFCFRLFQFPDADPEAEDRRPQYGLNFKEKNVAKPNFKWVKHWTNNPDFYFCFILRKFYNQRSNIFFKKLFQCHINFWFSAIVTWAEKYDTNSVQNIIGIHILLTYVCMFVLKILKSFCWRMGIL